MKASALYAALLAAHTLATPATFNKRENMDGDVLQYALTFKYLEEAFYKVTFKVIGR
jgi:hypothetical protein